MRSLSKLSQFTAIATISAFIASLLVFGIPSNASAYCLGYSEQSYYTSGGVDEADYWISGSSCDANQVYEGKIRDNYFDQWAGRIEVKVTSTYNFVEYRGNSNDWKHYGFADTNSYSLWQSCRADGNYCSAWKTNFGY